MSSALLSHLADRYTFDGSPGFLDLGAYHVPFDTMTGTTRVEARLTSGAARGERIALIAPSGSGKSSVVSHVLGPTATDVAPIVVPVHSLDDGATSPARIADELLMLLSRYPDQVRGLGNIDDPTMATGATRQVTHSHRHSSGVGLAWGWLRGELAREVQRQVQTDQPISLREKTELLDQALERIRRADLQPVIVFDDTDRWRDDTTTVTGFFRDVTRWLTELPVSLVVATHTHYFDIGVSREALLEFLDTPVEIPSLPSPDVLTTILARRIALNVEGTKYAGADLSAAVTAPAVNALFSTYTDGSSLRRVLQIAHVALAEAINADADAVDADHVTAAHQAG